MASSNAAEEAEQAALKMVNTSKKRFAHYEVLGVDKSASSADVKKAWP